MTDTHALAAEYKRLHTHEGMSALDLNVALARRDGNSCKSISADYGIDEPSVNRIWREWVRREFIRRGEDFGPNPNVANLIYAKTGKLCRDATLADLLPLITNKMETLATPGFGQKSFNELAQYTAYLELAEAA